jgi:NADH-quinone oxidoreductase subunit A
MFAYIGLFILIAVAVLLGLLLTSASGWIGPSRPSEEKEMAYESGMDPVGTATERFAVKFYMIAMLFILFDIEVVFMYPWAVQYKQLLSFGLFPFLEMLTFMIILFVGYIYVYKKGGLDWE